MPDIGVLGRKPASATGETTIPPPRMRWSTRIVLPGLILALLAGLIAYAARDSIFPAMPVKVVPVILRAAAGTDGPNATSGTVTVQAPGWVEADPYATFVGSLTDGVLKEILVLEGQPVTAGQVVARMIPDEAKIALLRADAELLQRQSDVKTAEARLTAAQSNWDNPIERNRAIASNEAMAAECIGEHERIVKDVAAETAREEALTKEYEWALRAIESKGISELELIKARKAMEAQKAMVAATQARMPIMVAKLNAIQADLTAARENLRLRIDETRELDQAKSAVSLAKAFVQVAEADRDRAKLNFERMEIRSPVAGIVMSRLKEPGDALMFSANMVNATQVLRVYDPARLQVRADVPLADAAQVGVGMKAQIVVSVLPDQTFEGEVTRIVHEADLQKNTLQVKVQIKNPSEKLKPEMLARVKFLSDGNPNTLQTNASENTSQRLFVPESLLTRSGATGTIWIVDGRSGNDKGIARLRSVTPGAQSINGWIEIQHGLFPGDLLIGSDRDKLSDGSRVRMIGETRTQ